MTLSSGSPVGIQLDAMPTPLLEAVGCQERAAGALRAPSPPQQHLISKSRSQSQTDHAYDPSTLVI